MLAQDGKVIFTSTPGYGRGMMTQLSTTVDDGEFICDSVNYDFTCEDCTVLRKEFRHTVCDCNEYKRPHIYNMKAIRRAMAAFGDDIDSAQRELFGTDISGAEPLNNPANVDAMMSNNAYETSKRPQFVFVAMDPNGASKPGRDVGNSLFAVVIFFVEDFKWVVRLYAFFFSMCPSMSVFY
jgi:hypothetical protein